MKRKILAALAVLAAIVTLSSACFDDLDSSIPYCDETNNWADLPTTVCDESTNLCICPTKGDIYCYKPGKCVPYDVCTPPPPCDPGDAGAPDGDGG